MDWWDGKIIQGYHWGWLPTPPWPLPCVAGCVCAHSGIDIGMPYGTPISCPFNGKIVGARCFPWGAQVDIQTKLNDKGGGSDDFIVSFLHLVEIAGQIQDHIGQSITAGTVLGYSGGLTSGKPCPTAFKNGHNIPHLHFEITWGTKAPYWGYNPWRPSLSSHPTDPTLVFEAIKNNGGVAPSSEPGGSNGGGGDNLTGPSPYGKAHNLLNTIPGFLGLCEALDAIETFEPFDPPAPDNTPVTGGLQTAGNTFGYAVRWTARNGGVLSVRVFIMLAGFVLAWVLVLGLIAANKWVQEAGQLAAAAAIGAV